jgi:tetratricopeptide (TPR) repeat protein
MDRIEREERDLEELGKRFMSALESKSSGNIDHAEDELVAIVRIEPRLAEPRMELARLLLDTGRIDDAEEHARAALGTLRTGGRWNEDVPEKVLLSMAAALLGEILRQRADGDDLIFGDADTFKGVLAEATALILEAAELDPTDEYASYHAFFMGSPQ